MAIPWALIEAEYITTNISQRDVAKKYNTTAASVNSHAQKGNWAEKRNEFVQKKLQEEFGIEESGELVPVDIVTSEDGTISLDLGEDAESLKPRKRYQRYSILAKKIPKYDKADPVQVKNRIESYFDFCNNNDIPPSPPDLARWLKITMYTFRLWRNGEFRKSTHQPIVEEAWTKLEGDLVNRIQTGTINPASGIFLLKNWFGYKDVQDIVVAPKNPLGDLQNPEELRKRIEGTVVEDE